MSEQQTEEEPEAESASVTRRKALQELAELTEELGLYDDTDAAGNPRKVAPNVFYNKDAPVNSPNPARYDSGPSCPMCGRATGTCRHRSGGPA